MTLLRFAVPLLFAFMAGACSSAPSAPPFGDVDADADGRIEWREYKASRPEATPKGFLVMDRDKDGRLAPDEWRAAGGDSIRTPPPPSSADGPQ